MGHLSAKLHSEPCQPAVGLPPVARTALLARASGPPKSTPLSVHPTGSTPSQHPQRDSNPCYRLERAASWAARRWGPDRWGNGDYQLSAPDLAGRRGLVRLPVEPRRVVDLDAQRREPVPDRVCLCEAALRRGQGCGSARADRRMVRRARPGSRIASAARSPSSTIIARSADSATVELVRLVRVRDPAHNSSLRSSAAATIASDRLLPSRPGTPTRACGSPGAAESRTGSSAAESWRVRVTAASRRALLPTRQMARCRTVAASALSSPAASCAASSSSRAVEITIARLATEDRPRPSPGR